MTLIQARSLTVVALLLAMPGCAPGPGQDTVAEPTAEVAVGATAKTCDTVPPYDPSPVTIERDRIFSLVAYGVVYKNWQTGTWGTPDARGYNIGGVLVDDDDQIVCWARNSVIRLGNDTQHGEVRLMVNYLHNDQDEVALHDYKLYTSLEPCAMCSGMMTMQSVRTTIYGQTDPSFGDALERLELNSTSLPNGYCPYPRPVQSEPSDLEQRRQLDEAYAASSAPDGTTGPSAQTNHSLTVFLTTETAREIYASAAESLASYELEHPEENQTVLAAAQEFLAGVPADPQDIPYSANCSG